MRMHETAAVVGAGVNGIAAAKTFLARGRDVSIYDVDEARAEAAAASLNTLQQSVLLSLLGARKRLVPTS